ncbi:ATP-binding protein [Sedimentisphaera salicampi]|uniref:Serine-protein kinase RsbW n=1 Tax=Sedimentisphaera salicampi TaxID=1941349 RepID=A0A1W6LPB0_9BACT|nr:ATP-binding protein [Sedimentisphaera salicampi]ARN57572.1 Serine-protein kinase RsbW [Sedimentisphaera salicampi]OXU14359.1 Serine-protein kinase RsbW [Sedimentisphaera salicampi]
MEKSETLCVSYPAQTQQLCDKIFAPAGSEISSDTVWWLRLAVAEALNNAIVHGNKRDPAKKVTVNFSWTDQAFSVTVTDQGEGFEREKLIDPTADENLNKTTGRGVYIIKYVMDDVQYNDKGNSITMTKYFS